MKKFHKDSRGVVTVIVTLLLIPALLITGTGVDLARIFTAKSIVRDANQMAANSVLTQYDAMLQDVYGLFAVASGDDALSEMVTEYVNLSLYGASSPTASQEMGTLPLFSGSVTTTQITKKQNLGHIAVLRHQIEDYAKFRAPVAIAKEVIDRLNSFDKMKTDADLIADKVAIDDMVADLQTMFNDLKRAIDAANNIDDQQLNYINRINNLLGEIKRQFGNLVSIRNEYVGAFDDSDYTFREEHMESCEDKYKICLDNIKRLAKGNGQLYTWSGGFEDEEEGEWIEIASHYLRSYPRSLKDEVNMAGRQKDSWSLLLDDAVRKCEQFDSKTDSIRLQIERLKAKLDSADCTVALRDGLKKQIAQYEALLWDANGNPITASQLGYDFRGTPSSGNSLMIDKFIQDIEGISGYGAVSNNVLDVNNALSFDTLGNLSSNNKSNIDATIQNRTLTGSNAIDTSWLTHWAYLGNYTYTLRFKTKDFKDISGDHETFYNNLSKLCSDVSSEASQSKGNILNYMKLIQEKIKGLVDYKPQGAGFYGSQSAGAESGEFGQGADWSSTDQVMDQSMGAMQEVSGIAKVLSEVTDKVLLVTYASEMFSSFVSPDTSEGEPPEISMSGVPIDTHVNYFYQSELEYLYNGNINSAAANLAAVSGTILMIRFVFNYISTFIPSVPVDEVLTALRSSFNVGGPIGGAIGIAVAELARVAFALGESVLDVTDLRNGDAVPLLKNGNTWKLSLQNIAEEAASLAVEGSEASHGAQGPDYFYYIDYLRILLLLRDGNEIARRMKNLIELNVSNIKGGVYQKGATIYGNESAMSGKVTMDLDTAGTAFEIATTVHLQFLFFPMSYFQDGVDGTAPPQSIDVSATSYRGY